MNALEQYLRPKSEYDILNERLQLLTESLKKLEEELKYLTMALNDIEEKVFKRS